MHHTFLSKWHLRLQKVATVKTQPFIAYLHEILEEGAVIFTKSFVHMFMVNTLEDLRVFSIAEMSRDFLRGVESRWLQFLP